MAQMLVTSDGTQIVPGAVVSYKVQSGSSALSTSGVLFVLGEADAGPDFSLETKLADNAYGPGQLSKVLAKYKSGPLCDAMRGAVAAANDPDLPGSFTLLIPVKTNVSTKASGALPKIGGGTYGTLYDQSYGQLGNLFYYQVAEKTAEVKPTTGEFTYIPPVGTVSYTLRVDGGASVGRTTVAAETPTAFVSGTNGLTGIDCTGGANRTVLTSTHGSLTVAVSSDVATFTLSVISAWDNNPEVGDTLMVPAGSAVAGAGNANVGAYVVTSVSDTVIVATKLSDAAKPGAVIGTITAPAAVSATPVTGANLDLVCYSPVVITDESTAVIDGIGKTLEINETTSGTDLLSRTAFVLGTTDAVDWVSTSDAPTALDSAAEYQVTMTLQRQADSVFDSISAGGDIALKLGYAGTSCAVVVTATTITLTPVGGSGPTLSLALKDFATLNDLAAYLNVQTDYTCSVGSAAVGSFSPLGLDEVTTTAGSTFGAKTCRIKVDAAKFYLALVAGSTHVQLGNPKAPAAKGLPDTMDTALFMSGGAKGGTTNTGFQAALDALKKVNGNFPVPLFARDASDDIADNLTDSSSTYTIAFIHAAVKSHNLLMSQTKYGRNRAAYLALQDTYENVKQAAFNLASFRCSLAFQDMKDTGANGIVQFQPWMTAVKAAAMQAAGFYKNITHKHINCSGVLTAAGDFDPEDVDQEEDALKAGLLFAKADPDGGYFWVSDQTTYSADDNFVFNSSGATYIADTIALTTRKRMEKAFTGQSVADISQPLAMAAFQSIMADFLRLKLIAKSDDAPKGYKNVIMSISGPSLLVEAEIKLAGAIYFENVRFLVTPVQQTA